MERFLRLLRVLLVRKVYQRADRVVAEARRRHSHAMSVYLLAQEMLALGADLSPYLLRHIFHEAARRRPGYGEFLRHTGDVRALAAHTGNDFMSAVLSRCKRLQMDEVTELLASPPPHRKIYQSEEIESRNPAQDYVPLGVRKSLARKQDPGTLERLLREQDPQVVKNLLANPRTTEEMVIKIASLRPTGEEVLEEIFINEKWSSRHRVRKALVFNPYSPPRAAHALLPLLTMPDIMEVSLSRNLHPSLVGAGKRIILHRMAEMEASEKEQFTRVYSNRLKRIFLQVG